MKIKLQEAITTIIKGLPDKSFWLFYDAEADVMYANIGSPPFLPADDTEDKAGVLIRYGEQGDLLGATVINASQYKKVAE